MIRERRQNTMMDNIESDRLWIEYENYIHENKLTKYERQLLRKWVRDGHSVYETVESEYLPGPAYPPMDFIDAYRLDRSIREDLRGLTKDEKDAYFKSLYGYAEPTPEEIEMEEAKKNTPKLIEDRVRQLERDFFHLTAYVQNLGLYTEAMKYVYETKDEEIPFEW